MLELGLGRISRLLAMTSRQSWKAVHVAGTNGKGSICAYLSAMLHASGKSCGRFTSPHLVDRWDCIAVDERPVSEALFLEVEHLVKQRDEEAQIGASEFELLTATAFEIFTREKVDFAVVEVGMGGRLDATNAMHHKNVAVITKIGLDHQPLLGNTLSEIALQKAGIMKPGVTVVVDPSNARSVIEVLEQHAREAQVRELVYATTSPLAALMAAEGWEPHQVQNLATAEWAFRLAVRDSQYQAALAAPLAEDDLTQRFLPILRKLEWPGRLQRINIGKLTGRQADILLDGAHNPQSAAVLGAYVQKHFRPACVPVTWVLGASAGKDVDSIFELLLQPGDRVAAVRFEPVDGMPWVSAADPPELLKVATRCGIDAADQFDSGGDIPAALRWASDESGNGPLVVSGSLYLISSVLRLLRNVRN